MIATLERSAPTAPLKINLERFIRQSKTRLVDFIRRRVATREDAEDLAQDVLYALAVNFDPTSSAERLTAWLFTAARNRVIDWYRTRKEFVHAPPTTGDQDDEGDFIDRLPDLDDGPDELLERVLFQEAFAQALKELPPEQRDVFVKHELEGKSIKEIAAESGASQSAVLSRKFYATRKLQKRLRGFYDPPEDYWSIS
jgi:RNA polymerase sigma factor (sigma-70 family)